MLLLMAFCSCVCLVVAVAFAVCACADGLLFRLRRLEDYFGGLGLAWASFVFWRLANTTVPYKTNTNTA